MRAVYPFPIDDTNVSTLIKLQCINPANDIGITGINLEESWTNDVQNAIVITGVGYESTVESAKANNIAVKVIESHDLTSTLAPEYRDSIEIKNIVIPASHNMGSISWHHQVRLMNHRLEYREVSRVFDHMSAWHHIMTVDRRPTIVLESCARLDRIIPKHFPRNSIIGLDTQGEWSNYNCNYRVMPGVWAYCIDQFAARRMFNRILDQGIRDPIDLMFRGDQQLIVLGKSFAHKETGV